MIISVCASVRFTIVAIEDCENDPLAKLTKADGPVNPSHSHLINQIPISSKSLPPPYTMYIRTIAGILVMLATITTTSSTPLLIKRIVNGTPIEEGELPVFAELINVDGEALGCGGSLIGSHTIVTGMTIFLLRLHLMHRKKKMKKSTFATARAI